MNLGRIVRMLRRSRRDSALLIGLIVVGVGADRACCGSRDDSAQPTRCRWTSSGPVTSATRRRGGPAPSAHARRGPRRDRDVSPTGLEFPRGLAVAMTSSTSPSSVRCRARTRSRAARASTSGRRIAEGERSLLESTAGRILAYPLTDDGAGRAAGRARRRAPFMNTDHGLNDLDLGPDGMLYLSVGNLDQLAWDDVTAIHHGPETELLGIVLRIDPATGADRASFATRPAQRLRARLRRGRRAVGRRQRRPRARAVALRGARAHRGGPRLRLPRRRHRRPVHAAHRVRHLDPAVGRRLGRRARPRRTRSSAAAADRSPAAARARWRRRGPCAQVDHRRVRDGRRVAARRAAAARHRARRRGLHGRSAESDALRATDRCRWRPTGAGQRSWIIVLVAGGASGSAVAVWLRARAALRGLRVRRRRPVLGHGQRPPRQRLRAAGAHDLQHRRHPVGLSAARDLPRGAARGRARPVPDPARRLGDRDAAGVLAPGARAHRRARGARSRSSRTG